MNKKLRDSISSLGEIHYRFFLAEQSIHLYYYFGIGLKETYEGYLDETAEYKARSVAASYAFIQIASVFDSKGKYSFGIQNHKNKPLVVSKKKLQELFPVLNDREIGSIHKSINITFLKHKETIRDVLQVRNQKLAHTGKIVRRVRSGTKHDMYSFKPLIPRRFSYRRILDLKRDIEESLFTPVEFALYGHGWH